MQASTTPRNEATKEDIAVVIPAHMQASTTCKINFLKMAFSGCHTCSYAGFYNTHSQFTIRGNQSCHTCSYAGFYNRNGVEKDSWFNSCHTCSYAGFYNRILKAPMFPLIVVIPAHMQASTTVLLQDPGRGF